MIYANKRMRKVLGLKSKNKFGAHRQEFQGNRYHSGREAQEASFLDLKRRSGEIKGWDRQVKISLDVNGRHIANYYVDFVVHHNDGTTEYREVKGFATDVFLLKWRLFEALYEGRPGVRLTIVK